VAQIENSIIWRGTGSVYPVIISTWSIEYFQKLVKKNFQEEVLGRHNAVETKIPSPSILLHPVSHPKLQAPNRFHFSVIRAVEIPFRGPDMRMAN